MKRFSLFVGLFLLLLLVPAPTSATIPIISRISPSSGPSGSTVTVTVTGDYFDSSSDVIFARCGMRYNTAGHMSGTTISWTDKKLIAEFQLTGVVGDYDVLVSSQTGTGVYERGFNLYRGSSSGTTTTTTATATTTTTVKTTTNPTYSGSNSVYFETNPSGAEIYLNGDHVGTSTFTYKTDRDGTFAVVVKKAGYEDYEDRVTILSGGQRVRFYASLIPLASTANNVTTNATPSASSPSASAKTTTTIRKSTLKIPTPLGTNPPLTEESPVNPATALGAAGIAIAFVLLRRR
jgi:hypothetical protein